jgi:hypothetical protein
VLRLFSELIICRQEGINPDISALAELTGLSRDTMRQIDSRFRERSEPYSDMVMDGRRRVYDESEALSPNLSRTLDELVRIFDGR